MALLCLTSDWYRNRMSIVDSHPSMSCALFAFFISSQNFFTVIIICWQLSSRRIKWRRNRKQSSEPFEPANTSRTLQTPRNIKKWKRDQNLFKQNNQKCKSSNVTFWLIRHYFIQARWFLWQPKIVERKSDNNERTERKRLKSEKFFSVQIEMSKMIYISFHFVSFMISKFSSGSTRKSKPAGSYEKGLIWRWNTLIYR